MIYSILFADNKEFWVRGGEYYLIKQCDTVLKIVSCRDNLEDLP